MYQITGQDHQGDGQDCYAQLCFLNINSLLVIGVPLNQSCTSGQLCNDTNASCQSGICRCSTGYFERQAVCGESKVIL